MSKLPFTYVVGLEVHCELNTATKMFCRCANDPFGAEPNQHTCPVCVALPGTLPVPNREAVRKTIFLGKALGSTIPAYSKFDRKHYFYPDSPKGYQISQFDLPLCDGGSLDLLDAQGGVEKTIRFERVHLEEDAGKLLHGSTPGYSQVDLNRAGVPLVEMVTKPDIATPEEARRFVQEVRLLVRALGISDADMEKGQMRADVNISIKFECEGEQVWSPITEVKNVNSTRSVERCILAEGQRMYDEWMADGPIRSRTAKITASFDENTGKTTIQRIKEDSSEYRYFPEPDIPPLVVFDEPDLNPENMTLPELPNARRLRYVGLGLSASDADIFINDTARLEVFESCLVTNPTQAKVVANWLVNAPTSALLSTADLLALAAAATEGVIAFAAVKPRLEELVSHRQEHSDKTVVDSLKALGLYQEHDAGMVQSAVAEVFAEQEATVAQYRAGETKVLGFLVGQVLKKLGGKAQPAKVQEAVVAAL